MLPKYYLKLPKTLKELDFIDFGSGFKVPYKNGDIETDVEEFGRKLTKRFLSFEKEHGRSLTTFGKRAPFQSFHVYNEKFYFLLNSN